MDLQKLWWLGVLRYRGTIHELRNSRRDRLLLPSFLLSYLPGTNIDSRRLCPSGVGIDPWALAMDHAKRFYEFFPTRRLGVIDSRRRQGWFPNIFQIFRKTETACDTPNLQTGASKTRLTIAKSAFC